MLVELRSTAPVPAVSSRGDDPPRTPRCGLRPRTGADTLPCSTPFLTSLSFAQLRRYPQYLPGGTTPRTPRCGLRPRTGVDTLPCSTPFLASLSFAQLRRCPQYLSGGTTPRTPRCGLRPRSRRLRHLVAPGLRAVARRRVPLSRKSPGGASRRCERRSAC
jgi:hypothetical protein